MTISTGSEMNTSANTIKDFEFDIFKENGIPVTVVLSLLCIVGAIGNAHALLIYTFRFKPMNCRVFVQWLSSVDLAVCLICIPFEISVIRLNLTFYSDVACKVFRLLTHVLCIASGIMLVVIAFHRRQKLGNPRGKQFSLQAAHLACLMVLLVTGLTTIPSAFFYKVEIFPLAALESEGHSCSLNYDVNEKPYFQIFIGFLTILATTGYILCIVAYSFVLKAIIRQLHCRSSVVTLKGNQCKEQKGFKTGSPFETLNHSKNITILFLVTTTISYAGYMCYLISTWVILATPGYLQHLNLTLSVINRGYFLSSAANPVVYLFLERKFRQEFKDFYFKLFGFITSLCNNREPKGESFS